jgi:hypothetical protein
MEMEMTKEERAEREAKARELFTQGLSVNKVAQQCFKDNWAAAKAVKDAMGGVTTKQTKRKASKQGGRLRPRKRLRAGT